MNTCGPLGRDGTELIDWHRKYWYTSSTVMRLCDYDWLSIERSMDLCYAGELRGVLNIGCISSVLLGSRVFSVWCNIIARWEN